MTDPAAARKWILPALALATSGLFAWFTVHDLGRMWSPLDDAFIYAQYASEMARGNLYEYHPGETMSTGVTSPLYPWLLVPAFWVGLGGERIVWWWLALGVFWRIWTGFLVHALVRRWTRDARPALFAAALALIHGNFNWGVSSGMEVGMMAVLLLAALRAGQRWLDRLERPVPEGGERRRRWVFVITLALLALSRPEGAVTVLFALALLGWWLRRRGAAALRPWAFLLLSLIPCLAWMLWVRAETGTLSTSGAKVKTMLGVPGYDLPAIVSTWLNGVRMTFSTDFLAYGAMPLWGWAAAAIGCAALMWRRHGGLRGPSARLPAAWLVGLLVPAFSLVPFVHALRYQAAHIPLLVALGVAGVWWFGAELPRIRGLLWGGLGAIVSVLFICHLFHSAQRFAMQTEDMVHLHRRISLWLREHTGETDRVAVTDAGIIPYLTGRKSIDFVGLTTTEMMGVLAEGRGGVWHTLERLKPDMRPDWLVMFPSWFDAADLGPVEAHFRADRSTIAVSSEMVITRWLPPLPWAEKRVPPEARSPASAPPETEETLQRKKKKGTRQTESLSESKDQELPFDPLRVETDEDAGKRIREPIPERLPAAEISPDPIRRLPETRTDPKKADAPTTPPWLLVDTLDMADLKSEREHAYRYADEAKWQAKRPAPLVVAQSSKDYVWRVADGGRSWTSFEEFTLRNVDPARPLRLSLRTYSDYPHRLRVFSGGREAGILVVPKNERSGIFDINNIDIPADALGGSTDPRIRLELIRDGDKDDYPLYTSFFLWALQPADSVDAPEKSPAEEKLEERIATEESRWARKFRERHGDAIPIDSHDQVLFQTGWDPPDEDDDGTPFRWGLGPHSFLVVPAPAAPETLPDDQPTTPANFLLEVTLEPYVPPARRRAFWNWIAVEVNGRELVRWDLKPRRETYRCAVPADLLYPNINGIRFVYARAYVPAEFEPGNDDTRPLGAKFYSITLKPHITD